MALSGRTTNDPANYFAMGVQGAKDVTASTFYFFKHLSGSGFDVTQEVQSEREGGGGREVTLRYKSMIKPDGQVVAYARPDVSGRLLAWALGSDTASLVASAAGQAPLISHTIQSGVNASLPYLTAQQYYADVVEQTTNNLIADLKVDGQAGRPLKFTAQFVSGGTVTQGVATQAAVREVSSPLMIPGASFSLAVTGGLDAGATSIEITKFTLDIKNTLDDAIQTLGLNREDVLWLLADYSLDGTLKYTDKAIWNQTFYGGNSGTTVQVGIPTCSFNMYSLVFGGSTSLRINSPLMNMSALKVNRLDPDGKTMYLDFTADSLAGATNSLFAQVITNATGAYTATAT